MAYRYGATTGYSVIAITIGFAIAASSTTAHAIPLSRGAWPIYTAVVEKTTPPSGWAEFCGNYKGECDVQSSLPRKIALTTEVWDKLVEVNRWANTHIKPTPDRKHWGRINKWYFAEDGRGDCKDYVLVKRRILMQAGLPREALLISVVWTPQNNGHAVLIVRTDKGDYVLDNLASKIVLWNQTPYDYVMRQAQSNPNTWVYIDGDPLKPPKLAEDVAENPLREPTVMLTGLNSGTPTIEVIADRETDGSKSKAQILATRSMNDSVSPQKFIAADDNSVRAIADRNDTTSGQPASEINDSDPLRQILANGTDGETWMQLAIAAMYGGKPFALVVGKRPTDDRGDASKQQAISTTGAQMDPILRLAGVGGI